MGNYHDQIGTDGRPNLGFDGIDALPIKLLDSQVLLNPFEEQFDLPPPLILVCDLLGITVENVGKQSNILLAFGINQV